MKRLLIFQFIFIISFQVENIQNTSPFIIKIENYNDFTFDAISQECIQKNGKDPIDIDLSQTSFDASNLDSGGLIHSPNFNRVSLQTNNTAKKYVNVCKWRLTAPKDYVFQLNLIDLDLEKKCNKFLFSALSSQNQITNEITTKSSDQLWLNFFDTNNSTNLHKIEQSKFDLCQNLTLFQNFIQINSNVNKMLIEYENDDENSYFLLAFKLRKSSTQTSNECNKITEMKCEIKLANLNQKTCINKDLICNCISLVPLFNENNNNYNERLNSIDNCDYLVEKYNNYLLALATDPISICSYYSNLNSKCRMDNSTSIASTHSSDSAQSSINLNENINWDNNEEIVKSSSNLDASYIPSNAKLPSQTYINHNNFQFKIENLNLNIQEFDDYCSNVFRTNEAGWIATPNFYAKKTQNYEMNTNFSCKYRIWTQIYQSVQLRFNFFNLNNENDSLIIYDGPNENYPILNKFTGKTHNNDYNKYFNAKAFNSKTNQLYIVFNSFVKENSSKTYSLNINSQRLMGFNFTYQIKGYCIEDQLQCNSPYELNCYSPNQTCNDVWDCHNGADERGCGPCKSDQFRCKNHIFCYRMEDRCDGDNQCIDKSDEMNCDKWFCNSNNGTFLCKNGRCVYEQWVCDGTNDCEDGSDEINCPSTFTSRRVITTAVLGGTLCSLLLVMALGCACKLYTLHTIGYRNNIRLSQTMQSAAAAAAAAASTTSSSNTNSSSTQPLLLGDNVVPSIAATSSFSNTTTTTNNESLNNNNNNNNSNNNRLNLNNIFNNVSTILRRPFSNANDSNANSINNTNNQANSTDPSTSNTATSEANTNNVIVPGELPLPHHLIAPPTYNQTMGLVDEYERRQLAFIEHVRTILSQQQQQQTSSNTNNNGIINLTSTNNQITSMTIIPTVTSSSTTVHRVTSSGGNSSRRHHRHHRHHHHNSNSNANTNETSNSSGHHRSHRRHRHHYSSSNTASNSSSSRHPNSLNSTNNQQISSSLQINFDANRRGLAQIQNELLETSNNQSNQNTTVQPSTSTTENSATAAAGAAPVVESLLNKPSSLLTTNTTSINLRNRLAKLIKDIVVHHGDNIQYVQLADQANSSSSSSNTSNNIVNNNSVINNNNNLESHFSNTRTNNTEQLPSPSSNNANNNNNNADDEPLIR